MKINLDQILVDEKNRPIKDEDITVSLNTALKELKGQTISVDELARKINEAQKDNLTVGLALRRSLLSPLNRDEKLDYAKAQIWFNIANEMVKGGEYELDNVKDATLIEEIKEGLRRAYNSPIIVGQIMNILNPIEKNNEKK